MRKIVILGAGAGGTMVAANLRKELDEDEWQITMIDKDELHSFWDLFEARRFEAQARLHCQRG